METKKKIYEKENLEKWANIVIERWQKRIDKLGIKDTNTLRDSLLSKVVNDANGGVGKINFFYAYYGLFPELGVGKGVPIELVDQSNRERKPWMNDIFFRELTFLTARAAEDYGEEAAEQIKFILESSNFNKI